MSKGMLPHSGYLDWLLTTRLGLWILFVLALITLILGTYGHLLYQEPAHLYFLNALYHAFQLFIMHVPHFEKPVPVALEIARWAGAITTSLIVVNVFILLLYRELNVLRLKYMKNHVIICGIGVRGLEVAVKLRQQDHKTVVAIEKNPEPEVVELLKKHKIILIVGDATKPEILQQAQLMKASSIYALCPDDTTNLAIADQAEALNKTRVAKCKVFVHINDSDMRLTFQTTPGKQMHSLSFIDAYNPLAQDLLTTILPLDQQGIPPESSSQVHLILLGFGKMGRSLAINAAQLGQFANRKKIKISVIDLQALKNAERLFFHHPDFKNVADIEFYEQDVQSLNTLKLFQNWCTAPNQLVSVVFCFDNTSLAVDTFLSLKAILSQKQVQVAIRTNNAACIRKLLDDLGCKQIKTFGVESKFGDWFLEAKSGQIKKAIAIHKAYVALVKKQAEKDPKILERYTPDVLADWKDLDANFRESSFQQAMHIPIKVQAAGYKIVPESDPRPAIMQFDKDIIEPLAILEHDRWIAERTVFNWKYGDPSDKPNRINRNLVEWGRLTPEIKQYDFDAVERIPELLKAVGEKMVERNQ